MRSHTIRATIGATVVAAMIGAAPATGTSANNAGEACTRGMHQVTVGGRPGFRFCGPASAVVHMGSRTLRFSNGLCRVAAGAFTVNIGTLVPGLRTGKPPSFGITTHTAKPGKQLYAAVGFAYGGRGYAVADQLVTLAPGLMGGTFSGRILDSGARVRGSFTC
jgi:hypothetical protein